MAKVWVCYVGEKGDAIKAFNSKAGPFPPAAGTEGLIAIGWPAVGDMTMYKGNYADYAAKFAKVYEHKRPNTQAVLAAMPWKFAFDMKTDDWVISPSSTHGLILVGHITGGYRSNFHNELELIEKRRIDYVHTRSVVWEYVILKTDSRYQHLSGWGKLTVFNPDITPEKLQEILGQKM
jgi:predicted Mrr-cat superfamily restriction endonuclease